MNRGDSGIAAPFPQKPKEIWRRSYERLAEEAFEAELNADTGIWTFMPSAVSIAEHKS
jgi:hypothetical protein